MITKTIPDERIIKILSEEIKTFGLEFAKTIDDGNVNKSAFDIFKNAIPKNSDNIIAGMYYGMHDMKRKEEPFVKEVCNILGADHCTNTAYYTKNGCCDWHTNSNNIGKRVYIIFTTVPGIFRYKDPFTNQFVDDYDFVGWTQREFTVDKENLLWHCVYSPAPRFSYGFNIK
jgi:hypothetical protein